MKITLCGSARFEAEFHKWNRQLTLGGNVVYTMAVFPSTMNNKDWYTPKQKELLDLVHLAKIEESAAIFVLDVDGYIGESTSREIEWARVRGKIVYYLSEKEDCDWLTRGD